MLIETLPLQMVKAAIDPVSWLIIGSMAVGAYNSWRARRQADKVNEQNLEESRRVMAEQRSHALQDWDKVQSYNSPSQQMERYRSAGLNPQLIYGNAQNSPAAMIRNTTQGAARQDAGEVVNAIQGSSTAVNTALNQFMSVKALQNDTNLKNAQILNLKQQSDKTDLDNQLTRKQFNELALNATVNNDLKRGRFDLMRSEAENRPTEKMAMKRYNLETDRVQELLNLAKQQKKLNQYDIDMIEKLAGVKGGDKYIVEFLKILIQQGLRGLSK
jgi:hypothetical protein